MDGLAEVAYAGDNALKADVYIAKHRGDEYLPAVWPADIVLDAGAYLNDMNTRYETSANSVESHCVANEPAAYCGALAFQPGGFCRCRLFLFARNLELQKDP